MILPSLLAAWMASVAAQPAADQEMFASIMSGWVTARDLSREGASVGGQAAILTAAFNRLEVWIAEAQRGTTPRDAIRALELRYADAAIRAAVDASQDERDEMAVFLLHARDLSHQLDLLGGRARWPLPMDEVDGELWLEVDRYAEARDAYQRAATATGSQGAWVGLARASAKLGDAPGACAAYRAALRTELLPDVREEADKYVMSPACGVVSRLSTPASRLP